MTWYAQAEQDRWIYETIGMYGFYVDAGAHDGVSHSNTYALEKLGWDGICIEPSPTAAQTCRKVRRCAVHECLASDSIADLPFNGVSVCSLEEFARQPSLTLVQALPIEHLLPEGQAIDYLSIDVEGHELKVLRGIDFETRHVTAITIEHNLYLNGPMQKEMIRIYLEARGFEIARENVVAPGFGIYEDWYIHSDDA